MPVPKTVDDYTVSTFDPTPLFGFEVGAPQIPARLPLPEIVTANDFSLNGLKQIIRVSDLPRDMTHVQGTLYFGRQMNDAAELERQTKKLFVRGRPGIAGHYNLTWHGSVAGHRKMGFSGFYSATENFSSAQIFSNSQDTSQISVIYVIEGKGVPGINIPRLKKIYPDLFLFSANQEAEVALTSVDPRQIRGAWLQRSVKGQALPPGMYEAKYRTYDFIENPNYDPDWLPKNEWPAR